MIKEYGYWGLMLNQDSCLVFSALNEQNYYTKA